MKFTRALVFLFLCVSLSAFSQNVPAIRSRAEFAAAMAKVTGGMPESEVLALLGRPDDVRTETDPGWTGGIFIKEVWCYGTDGHMGFPTLGYVCINTNGLAQKIFGGKGHPPPASLFTEAELQNILRLLDTTPSMDGFNFNPLAVIQIVNKLQPLGREKALAAMDEYLRVEDIWSFPKRPDLFPVLLVLFDLPDDVDAHSAITSDFVRSTRSKHSHPLYSRPPPRFPIALVDDIPLLLRDGLGINFFPPPPQYTVNFFRTHGIFRSKPLTPGDDPIGAFKHLMKSASWIYAQSLLGEPKRSTTTDNGNNFDKAEAMEQLLRLIDSVYRLPADQDGRRLACRWNAPPEPAWEKVVDAVNNLTIKWDASQQLYTFQNGQHLPPPVKKIYRRVIWPLNGMGFDHAEMILERRNDAGVEIDVNTAETKGAGLKRAVLELTIDGTNQPALATFSFKHKTATGGDTMEGDIIRLTDGTAVIARVRMPGHETNSSPVFKP